MFIEREPIDIANEDVIVRNNKGRLTYESFKVNEYCDVIINSYSHYDDLILVQEDKELIGQRM